MVLGHRAGIVGHVGRVRFPVRTIRAHIKQLQRSQKGRQDPEHPQAPLGNSRKVCHCVVQCPHHKQLGDGGVPPHECCKPRHKSVRWVIVRIVHVMRRMRMMTVVVDVQRSVRHAGKEEGSHCTDRRVAAPAAHNRTMHSVVSGNEEPRVQKALQCHMDPCMHHGWVEGGNEQAPQ